MPGGRVAVREIVEHPGAVAIAALDADDRLMMIHQYRHAVGRRLWELPAGLLDVRGEDPLRHRPARAGRGGRAGGRRTGRCWSTWRPRPASPTRRCGCTSPAGSPRWAVPSTRDDEEADLATRWVSLPVAVRMVLAGKIVNAATVAGVLAAHALSGAPAAARPADAPWPDRPTRFAERR